MYHFNEHKLISKFLQNYFGINLGLKGLEVLHDTCDCEMIIYLMQKQTVASSQTNLQLAT